VIRVVATDRSGGLVPILRFFPSRFCGLSGLTFIQISIIYRIDGNVTPMSCGHTA
jgi:hypothetical protein